MIRYAIQFEDGSWYCQGLPKNPTFEFAIMYASLEHVKTAMKKKEHWFKRTPYKIIPVTCTMGAPITLQ